MDDSHPLNDINPKACRVVVKSIGSTGLPVSLVNEGYWGINVKKDALYHFSLYARGDAGPLTVSLRGETGHVLADATLPKLTDAWQRLAVDLTANADDPVAKLVLSTSTPGAFSVNIVSLFPDDTFKHHPNGLRKDLAEMAAAMHPAFIRFPGGCYVEGGDYTANRFNWRNTVGDIAKRPGHANATWGYWSTDGLGFHEYLQFCEDLKAAPLFVVNVGMSHKEVVPMEKIPALVQEAMDGLEYANGPVDSQYGAMRAANGHPAPFNIQYVEIGNENGSWGGTNPAYTKRYKVMYDAIKAKYPQIKTVANARVELPMDIVDDHVYEAPKWFWSNIHQYDGTSRNKKPEIYVGEYADTIECGIGNQRAALAEAAYMTGFERNADVVKMSSYAPMYVQTNNRLWNPDAIVFDSSRVFGTPSYWVQCLYAENRPDVSLPTDVSVPEAEKPSVAKGGIGLGTWATTAEYKDIVVTVAGKTVYASGGDTAGAKWNPQQGQWSEKDGLIKQTGGGENLKSLLSLSALTDATDYTVTLKARKTGGNEGFLILFHANDTGNFSWWNIGGWGNTLTGIETGSAGQKAEDGPRSPNHVETGRWYDLKIELTGRRTRCYIDGQLVKDVTDTQPVRFTAIAGRKDDGYVVKVVNGSSAAVTSQLTFTGDKLQPTGQSITLASTNDADENTFADPMKISPKTAS